MSDERIAELLALADPPLDDDLLDFETEPVLVLPACSSSTLDLIERQIDEAMEEIADELGYMPPPFFRSYVADLGLFEQTNMAARALAHRTRLSLN